MEVISCLPGPETDAGKVGVDCGQHVLLDIASDLVTLHTPGDEGKVPIAGEPLLLLCCSHRLARAQDHGGGHGAHVGAEHVEVTVLLDACEQLLLVIVLLARTVPVHGAQSHVTLDPS